MNHVNMVWAGVFTLSFFLIAPAFGQEDVIEKRKTLMKGQGAAAKAIKKGVEEKDYATVELKAKEITGSATKIADLFPKGSTSEKSRAKDEIWEKWDDFTKNADHLKNSSADLAKAAAAKDEGRVKASFDELDKACGSCHKAFRKEKKS